MNKNFWTERATRASKNAFYWMRKATDAMKRGALVYFATSTAAQYAHEVEIIQEQTRAAEIALDWEQIAKTAQEQANKQYKQEQDAERKAERAYKKHGTRAEMVFID